MGKHFGARPTRRDVLRGAAIGALAAGGLARPAIAQTRNVTLTLPWVPEGPNLMTFVAKANGYWSKEKLNVDIAKGTGSVGAAQAVGNGQFQFGVSAATAGLQQAALGLPIAQISCCSYDAFMAVVTMSDSGVAKPKDLEGKKIACTAKSGDFPFLPVFAANAGVDLSKVEILQVDLNVRQRLLIEKQVSAISAFAPSVVPGYLANGFSPKIMLFSQYNLPLFGNCLFTQQALLEKEPGFCGAIAEGLNEAIKFVLLKPEESLDIFFKANPEMALAKGARELNKLALDFFRYSVMHDASKQNGIGYAPPADYKTMMDLVMKYVAPEGKQPDLEKVVSNKYAGGVKLTAAEWETVKASCSDVTKLLS
ncbi:ABC transporter substrate-binding protein [Rhodoplanes sp. Z2-YC6860]|uniref:ABC transporter substrate-binding protein n=1 Tax=Rhodoplanes sp. Z2-YC6860 TaxID=674703 RepID=UPI00078D6A54|nr:ABC transporter substrate-binding protein [Rhodoplanes sp. Z2-YC6860]AMN41102.1 ABC transporter substrate-binding protein [Rhodoplanes sp. Z2-YC6860]